MLPENQASSAVEWNFDAVPESELIACCWWEYARESTTLREWVALPVKNSKPISRNEQARRWKFLLSIMRYSQLFNECVFSPFPTVDDPLSFPAPWQMLSPDERKKRSYPVLLEHVRKPAERACSGTVSLLGEKAATAYSKWCREVSRRRRMMPTPFVQEISGEREVVAFEVLWGHFSNSKIKAAFAEWVDANRPPPIPEPSDGSGKKPIDWRKKLRDLGVLRLTKRWTPGQFRYIPGAAVYFAGWEHSQFSAARKRALENFHELLPFLNPRELPIHARTPRER